MQSALYYPFTGPERGSFLKTSLFLWDTVDFIVPHSGFRPHGRNAAEDKALEIIGRSYVPTDEDKKGAHEELSKLCSGPIPETFKFELERPHLNYAFYPKKLLPETWDMLADSKLAKVVHDKESVSHASTSPLFGYYMMSILAVCCSHDRKRLVTDQHDPYRTLSNIMSDIPDITGAQEDWHGRLIALTLNGPNFNNVSLQRLIELRLKENKLLQDLRQAFLKGVDSAAIDISANANNPNTVRDIIEQFNHSMELDLAELKKALYLSAASLILTKEFAISALAVVAISSFVPIAGSLASVGILTKDLLDYQDRRRKVLRDHPSSWLFEVTGPALALV